MNKIVELIHGSHLYGLERPDGTSDKDYKGCYLLTKEELILQNGAQTITLSSNKTNDKNTAADTDIQYFSLHKLLDLAYKGEMTVIDMIHAPKDKLVITSEYWEFIYNNRARFYTKNMSAYFGYILSQVNKYSQRGGRLKAVEEVIGYLKGCKPGEILQTYWSELPLNKYTQFVKDERNFEMYESCGRKVHPTVAVSYALEIFKTYANGYGNRARLAKENEIDFKAVSHAFRAVDQVEQMLTDGDITFPLKNKEKILQIKLGQIQNTNNELFDELSLKVDELQDKLNKSNLPSSVDRTFWQNWLLQIYES